MKSFLTVCFLIAVTLQLAAAPARLTPPRCDPPAILPNLTGRWCYNFEIIQNGQQLYAERTWLKERAYGWIADDGLVVLCWYDACDRLCGIHFLRLQTDGALRGRYIPVVDDGTMSEWPAALWPTE